MDSLGTPATDTRQLVGSLRSRGLGGGFGELLVRGYADGAGDLNRLLGMYGQHQLTADSAVVHQVFLYTYLSMALIIALPAWVFSRVPEDAQKNALIDRRRTAASSPDPMRKS